MSCAQAHRNMGIQKRKQADLFTMLPVCLANREGGDPMSLLSVNSHWRRGGVGGVVWWVACLLACLLACLVLPGRNKAALSCTDANGSCRYYRNITVIIILILY